MKKLLTIILALVMVLSLAACTAAPETETTGNAAETTGETTAAQTEQTGELKHITVTVVHSDETSKVFEYDTAEEFLGPLLEAEGLILGNEGPYGLEIIEVDGEQAVYETSGAYWALYEGEEYALQGIDTTPVVDQGSYKLVYTRG